MKIKLSVLLGMGVCVVAIGSSVFAGNSKFGKACKTSTGSVCTGSMRPFSGDMKLFSGDRKLFSGDMRPFSGDMRLFSGDRKPFSGEMRPFSDGTQDIDTTTTTGVSYKAPNGKVYAISYVEGKGYISTTFSAAKYFSTLNEIKAYINKNNVKKVTTKKATKTTK